MTPRRGGLLALLVLVAAVAALAAPAAGLGERPFDANEQVSPGGYDVYTLSGSDTRVAQSFTPSETFVLRNVTVYVSGGGNEALNLTIEGGASVPDDGDVLASAERVSTAEGWLDFPFIPSPTLAAGTRYWIVARSSASFLDPYAWHHSNGDVVPGEARTRTEPSPTWTSLPNDLTYVAFGVRYEPQIVVGLSADRRSAAPGETVTYTAYLNNTGFRAPPTAWVNLTLDPGLTYITDTAATLNGVRSGLSWTFSELANGIHSFRITAQLAASVVGGSRLNATVHLDYVDSTQASQVPSTARATIVVALKTKPMHMWHDGNVDKADEFRAAPPTGALIDFDGDGAVGMTVEATESTWTLTPVLARPLSLRGVITADLFLNAPNPGAAATLNLTLYDRRNVVATLITWRQTDVTLDSNPADFELVPLDLGTANHWISAGNQTELRIAKVAGDDLWLAYGQSDVPSRVLVTTDTYVRIDDVETVDDRGLSGLFSSRDNVNVRVNVSDPFGSSEIAGVGIEVTVPDGSVVGSTLALVATDPATPSAWKRFAFVQPQPQVQGDYAFVLTATERNGVEFTATGTFRVAYPAIGLAVDQDVQSARPNGLVRFTLTFDNDGLGSGPVWINVTLPPELEYVQDTAATSGGARTGAGNWTFDAVDPGPHAFEIVVRVSPGAANGTVAARFELAYEDAKGYAWFAGTEVRFLDVFVAAGGGPFSNPVVLALLGATVVVVPLAAYVLWKNRRPAIEEAFLIHKDGVLIYHLSRSLGGEGEKDRDILGAMLTAVQDFVKDSFRYGENRELNRLEFGDYQVLIERGKHIFLAVVIEGTSGENEARRRVRQVIGDVEAKYGDMLAEWSGDVDRTLGVRDIVKRLVSRD